MLWVGNMEKDYVVFEEDLQTESPYLKLWSFKENEILSFDREQARLKVKTLKDEVLKKEIEAKYRLWKESSYFSYISEEKEAAARRKGFDLARKQMGRENWCHTCALPLKAKLTNVCGKCGWIKCSNCGACNCPC